MIIAMGVMLVTSLLLTASFLATQGDIRLSHTDTAQKEAYYAALAGVQEFEYQMQVNPELLGDLRQNRPNTLPQESGSSYKVKILPAADSDRMQHLQSIRDGDRIDRRRGQHVPDRIRRLLPAMNRKSITRSSRRSKSRDSSTSSTTRTMRTKILRFRSTHPRTLQKPKYILSKYDGMRPDPFCDRR